MKRKYIIIVGIFAIIYGGSFLWYYIDQNREAVKFFQAQEVVLLHVLEEEKITKSLLHMGEGDHPFYLSPDARYLLYFNDKLELVLEDSVLQTSEVLQNPILANMTIKSSEIYEGYSSDRERRFVSTIPKWSPDSRYVLLPVAEELYIFDVRTNKFTKVSSDPLLVRSNHTQVYNAWNNSNNEWFGNQIVYLCRKKEATLPELCIVSLDGKLVKKVRLYEQSLLGQIDFLLSFSTSRTGEYAIFYTLFESGSVGENIQYGGPEEIILIDKMGNIIKKWAVKHTLNHDFFFPHSFTWSPDGLSFIFRDSPATAIVDNVALELVTQNEIEKKILSKVYKNANLMWTAKGVFIDNLTEFIRINQETLGKEIVSYDVRQDLKYELPKTRTGSLLFAPRPFVSPSGRFIVETFGTHPVLTLSGELPKYIRLAAKDILSGKIVELMWDTLGEGGGTEESYSFYFADSNLLIVVREQDYHMQDSESKTRYFIYKVDLASLPAFAQ